MRKIVGIGKLVLLLCVATAVDARELTVRAARIDAGPVQVRTAQLTIDWPDHRNDSARADPQLALTVERFDAAALGYRFDRLRWQCPLQRSDDGWRCDGELRAATLPPARLIVQIDDSGPQLRLQRGRVRLTVGSDDEAWPIDARAVPADWLLPLLQQAWPALTTLDGPLDGALRFVPRDDGWSLDGRLASDGLTLDNADGTIASAGLVFDARLRLDNRPQQFSVDGTLGLGGGEWLLGPLYSVLPSTPVALELTARIEASGWTIDSLRWSDPGVLQLDARARLRPDAPSPLQSLDLHVESADLGTAHARYLEALLGSLGGSGLRPRGGLTLDLDHPAAGQWNVTAGVAGFGIDDARGRFALADADGELHWSTGAEARPGTLRWRSASVHGIEFGPADLALRSRDGWLRLDAPLTLAALGGRVVVDPLGWRPPLGERSLELDLGLDLQQLDLAQLAERFGWPPFTGELSGRMPAARYEDGVLGFDGGLRIGVFDGHIDVQSLRMERPFGVAPRLEADIAIERLDLQPLTAAFGFGEITGRLDGRLGGLRLIDWKPVAFEAELRSSARGGERRRISARAVDDLTRIGGGGVVAGVQKQMLKLFDSFAYSRIGLACTLRNEVCRMGGLEAANGGYLIVDGAGLPHITVIGHQRQVDWPVLIERLRAATEGGKIRLD